MPLAQPVPARARASSDLIKAGTAEISTRQIHALPTDVYTTSAPFATHTRAGLATHYTGNGYKCSPHGLGKHWRARIDGTITSGDVWLSRPSSL